MDKQLKKIKEKIIDNIRSYYFHKFANKKFIPGKTYIPVSGKVFDHKDMISLTGSVLDFWLTEGRFSRKFVEDFSNYLGVAYVSLTNSGSSANLLAFSTLMSRKLGKKRIKPGDEIITIAAGFPTTINPIIQCGCIPVFVDISLETLNIDVKKIEKSITKKTKAIILAHTLGNPFNIDVVAKLAKKYKLFLIEDCCDALGSTYRSKLVGRFGDIATFSFYPAHQITMGEGGAVATKSLVLHRIIRSFRDWGRDCWCETGQDNTCGNRFGWKLGKLPFGYDHKYIYSHIGYNLKLTDMQASIGLSQLKKLPLFIKKRRQNFSVLLSGLKQYSKYFIFINKTPYSNPSWFGFPIIIKEDAGFTRNELVNFLEEHNIATGMLFGGNLIKQPAYSDTKYKISGSLKNTDYILDNLFWIGVYPGIGKDQIKYMLDIFKSFLSKRSLI